MANFTEAYNKTASHEGGYVDDPLDAGRETYKGISRRFHPTWAGWQIIDQHKDDPEFPECLYDIGYLQELVTRFYKKTYWTSFYMDAISDQPLANELFDIAVNMGKKRATEFLQRGLNLLNRDERNYSNIVEDGQFGVITFKALRKYLTIDDAGYLRKILVILRGMHYIAYMTEDETQERFARGWLNRVKF